MWTSDAQRRNGVSFLLSGATTWARVIPRPSSLQSGSSGALGFMCRLHAGHSEQNFSNANLAVTEPRNLAVKSVETPGEGPRTTSVSAAASWLVFLDEHWCAIYSPTGLLRRGVPAQRGQLGLHLDALYSSRKRGKGELAGYECIFGSDCTVTIIDDWCILVKASQLEPSCSSFLARLRSARSACSLK